MELFEAFRLFNLVDRCPDATRIYDGGRVYTVERSQGSDQYPREKDGRAVKCSDALEKRLFREFGLIKRREIRDEYHPGGIYRPGDDKGIQINIGINRIERADRNLHIDLIFDFVSNETRRDCEPIAPYVLKRLAPLARSAEYASRAFCAHHVNGNWPFNSQTSAVELRYEKGNLRTIVPEIGKVIKVFCDILK